MHRSAILAAAALVALATVGPAHASAEASPPTRGRGMLLTLAGGQNTWMRGVLLRCPPLPGSAHPHARAACRALHAARGDLELLAGEPRPCHRNFDPVTARAVGSWRGRTVTWQRTYVNACVLDAATGAVFRF
jgi:hypothetical protein